MTSAFTVPGPPARSLLRRLRAWSDSAWQHADRIARAERAARDLADLAAAARGEQIRTVPRVRPFALADQLEVLRRDAHAAGAEPAAIDAIFDELAADLGFR